MALMKAVINALAIAAMVAVPALAKDFVVGDDSGWKLDFDYQDWAKGKTFQVGDRLIFKYNKGSHNVIKVDGKGFQQCSIPENSEPLATGNDIIALATPGKKWYICGFPGHCESVMKLSITVQSQGSSDSSPNSAAETAPKFLASIVAAFCVFVFMMI